MKAITFKRIGYVLLGAFMIGAMFRIMHWPFAGMLMLCGNIGAIISFLLYFSLKPDQSFYDKGATVLIPFMLSIVILRSLPNDFQLYYLLACALVSGSFAIYHILKFLKSSPRESMKLSTMNWEYLLYGIGAVFVILGVIIKYVYYPYAGFFLVSGISILAFSFVVGLFAKKEEED